MFENVTLESARAEVLDGRQNIVSRNRPAERLRVVILPANMNKPHQRRKGARMVGLRGEMPLVASCSGWADWPKLAQFSPREIAWQVAIAC
jgi:hypothetical protein